MVSPNEPLFHKTIDSTKTSEVIKDNTAFSVIEMLIAPKIGGVRAKRIHERDILRAFRSKTAYVSVEMQKVASVAQAHPIIPNLGINKKLSVTLVIAPDIAANIDMYVAEIACE